MIYYSIALTKSNWHLYSSLGMHSIIDTVLVSANIGFKINHRISVSTPISADIITDKIAVSLIKSPSWSNGSHVSWQTLCLLTMSRLKKAKFAQVVGIVMIVSGGATPSFKLEISYLYCLKVIVTNKYGMLYVTYVQVFFFFCTRNEY